MIGPAERSITAASPAFGRGRWANLTRQERLAYRLLLPVLLVVVGVATIAFVLAVIQSFTARDGSIGLDNYARALSNPALYAALIATAGYAAIVLPLQALIGIGLALLVHRTLHSPVLRAAIYVLAIVPLVIPPVAVGVVARLIFAPEYGALNHILISSGLIATDIPWLSSPAGAMLAVASVDVWQWTPFVYLVVFAGLQTVPQETVEAAQVDGASSWGQFWHIELPYLRPLLILVLFFRVADVLRVFDHVFILTGGGPGSTTQFLSLHLYRIGFKFSDLGQAAALAVVVMLVLAITYGLVTKVVKVVRE